MDELFLNAKCSIEKKPQLISHKMKDSHLDEKILEEGLSSFLEAENFHPVIAQNSYAIQNLYNQLNYYEDLDIVLTASRMQESFIKRVDETYFVNLGTYIDHKKRVLGEYLIIKLAKNNKCYMEIYKNSN